MISRLFSFNTDSKELERHLRSHAIAYLLEQTEEKLGKKEQGKSVAVAQVKVVAEIVAGTFGKKESFKLLSIAKEVLSEQLESSAQSTALTIPASQWPGALGRLPSPHPALLASLVSFEEEYARKFHKRKL
mmetsp:Transcript_23003/g.35551  ORF Transcript_23003/g.35551 Transcript_23003/m.35551 type:complete len:131 (+) Transcript_23003:1340-1732(+)